MRSVAVSGCLDGGIFRTDPVSHIEVGLTHGLGADARGRDGHVQEETWPISALAI